MPRGALGQRPTHLAHGPAVLQERQPQHRIRHLTPIHHRVVTPLRRHALAEVARSRCARLGGIGRPRQVERRHGSVLAAHPAGLPLRGHVPPAGPRRHPPTGRVRPRAAGPRRPPLPPPLLRSCHYHCRDSASSRSRGGCVRGLPARERSGGGPASPGHPSWPHSARNRTPPPPPWGRHPQRRKPPVPAWPAARWARAPDGRATSPAPRRRSHPHLSPSRAPAPTAARGTATKTAPAPPMTWPGARQTRQPDAESEAGRQQAPRRSGDTRHWSPRPQWSERAHWSARYPPPRLPEPEPAAPR